MGIIGILRVPGVLVGVLMAAVVVAVVKKPVVVVLLTAKMATVGAMKVCITETAGKGSISLMGGGDGDDADDDRMVVVIIGIGSMLCHAMK